jgi:hypothetical protein
MKGRIAALVLRILLTHVSEEAAKKLIDDFIDKVEDQVKDNPAAIHAINYVRRVIDVPDDIGGDED